MENKVSESQISDTIRQQIGNRAFSMLGATNLMFSSKEPNWLSFRIKGSSKINYIKISLNSMDLYDMEFGKIGKTSYKVVATESGCYHDMLHTMIEKNTGLYTSL